MPPAGLPGRLSEGPPGGQRGTPIEYLQKSVNVAKIYVPKNVSSPKNGLLFTILTHNTLASEELCGFGN
ncbi:MAG: hypothetical protein GY757_14885 [bacterium]|nr:hypothetical protein [bacterium]